MPTIDLHYGSGMIQFHLAERCLAQVASPATLLGPDNPESLILNALDNAIGSPPLEQLVKPGEKVAVIIDDVSRETPAHLILPAVLDRLHRGGVAPGDIRIVIALGTHRPMTDSELAIKTGPGLVGRYAVVNQPCHEDGEMVFMGTSGSGIPAWVNRSVAEADIRVGIGSITPHMDAGYSGGAKIILPGVCNAATVNAFHTGQARFSGSQLGVEDAPLRLELEAFVQERVGLDFIVNVVLDGRGSVYQCVAGHFRDAHRQGVRHAQEIFGIPVSRRYPIVVSNAYPGQADLWQSTKAIASGEIMTSDGGTLILLTECPEGNKSHPAFSKYIGATKEHLRQLLEDGTAEDPVACAIAVPICSIKERIRIVLVSHGLTDAACSEMGFARYDSLESAVERALSALDNPEKSVGILTHGGVSLPVISR